MSTRFCLGLGSVALAVALGSCGRAAEPVDQTSPDATMINASAALVDAPSGSVFADRPDTCQAARARNFIGRTDNPATRAALGAGVGQRVVRWIKPGTPVTQDLQPGRLNVIVVEDGRIGSLRCG